MNRSTINAALIAALCETPLDSGLQNFDKIMDSKIIFYME